MTSYEKWHALRSLRMTSYEKWHALRSLSGRSDSPRAVTGTEILSLMAEDLVSWGLFGGWDLTEKGEASIAHFEGTHQR